MVDSSSPVRLAKPADAPVVARLLHDFNMEFDTPSPGVEVLAQRLGLLLDTPTTFALLAADVGVALVTLRPNVWYPGLVALLDELYVKPSLRNQNIGSRLIAALFAEADQRDVSSIEINVDEGDEAAQRFYQRHGFLLSEPGSDERAFYFWRERDDAGFAF